MDVLVIVLAIILALNVLLGLALLILYRWRELHPVEGWVPEPDDPRWYPGMSDLPGDLRDTFLREAL